MNRKEVMTILPRKIALTVVAISSVAFASGWRSNPAQEKTTPRKRSQAERGLKPQGEPKPITRTQIFMREKLQSCNQILQGLCSDEFDDVANGADRLLNMSKRSHWLRPGNPVYTQDTVDFVGNVRLLRSMAKEENLAGATLAYSQLMVRCSDCHNHVRGPKVAALSPQKEQLFTRTGRRD